MAIFGVLPLFTFFLLLCVVHVQYSVPLEAYQARKQGYVLQNNTNNIYFQSHHFKKPLEHQISINADVEVGELKHFWKSTGLCPPDPHNESYKFFLSNDMQLNVAYIGSLSNNGITHVRIHWLLDMVETNFNELGQVRWDFKLLDELVHLLWKYDLSFGFELMGNPSGLFSDFENVTQVYWWRDLVKDLANHYIDMYSLQYVQKWNFETWNEPDHHDFDGLNFTVQGFLNYYDACSEGLASVSKSLILGGPGGSCHIPGSEKSPLCWALLKHCSSGRNFFTHETGVRLDFISFHKKGNGSSAIILQEEISTIQYIKEKFPSLSHVPFYNDEADPLKNWSLDEWWRADATYAAMVVKVIIQHIQLYFYSKNVAEHNVNFGRLSNDNAFLSYFPHQFTQRTLVARFQINNTNPNYTEFVRKPVYGVMGLLSNLCYKLVEVSKDNDGIEKNSLDVVATYCGSHSWQLNILICNSDDTENSTDVTHINIIINSLFLSVSDVKVAVYQVNNVETNSYLAWEAIGYPPYPSIEEFFTIKAQEEPFLDYLSDVRMDLPWKFEVAVHKPGVSFVNICARRSPPFMVENLQILNISTHTALISWSDSKNGCILTYNVFYSSSDHGPFVQLNRNFVKFCSFWYACIKPGVLCDIHGFYKVEAVDYWEQHGPFTELQEF